MIYIYIIRKFRNGNEKKKKKELSKILSRKFIDPLSYAFEKLERERERKKERSSISINHR